MINESIINILKKLNNKAKINGDIPVSAIILKNNKIISKAYNKKYYNNNPFDHAEILAIKKACKRLKTCNLIECDMIVTLEPCLMCKEVIKESKIRNVFFIADNNKIINNKTLFKKIEYNDYFSKELKDFFANKR